MNNLEEFNKLSMEEQEKYILKLLKTYYKTHEGKQEKINIFFKEIEMETLHQAVSCLDKLL